MAKSVDQISLIRLDHLIRQFGFSNGNLSGQTSHDLGPQMVVKRKGNPLKFQGNLGEGEIFFHLARVTCMMNTMELCDFSQIYSFTNKKHHPKTSSGP